MANSSWDNGGQGVPVKAGMPTWGKVLLGCGIAFLVVLATCVGGVTYMAQKIKKDPEGFKKKAMSAVVEKLQLRPDWEDYRAVVEQLRTPEGSQALYAANPALAKTWPTEAAFLEAASRWHKDLISVPELTPEVMEHQGLEIHKNLEGGVRVSWNPRSGRSVYVTFENTRKPGDKGPRRIAELEVR